jgi:hypothetical protein
MTDVPSASVGGEMPAAVGPVGPAATGAEIPAVETGDQAIPNTTAETTQPDPTMAILQQLERGMADATEPNDGQGEADGNAGEASRSALESIAAGPQEMERREVVKAMTERENWYQHTFGERAGQGDPAVVIAKRQELTERYMSEGASRAVVEQRIEEYAVKVEANRNAGLEAIPEDTAFDTEGSRDLIMAQAEPLIQAYFKSDRGSFSKEGELDQAGIVREQSQQYVQLVADAIAEGSISRDITAREVYKLVADNIAALGLQDRAASEVLIGDHGVRHLVDHNTRVASLLATQLAEKGYPMTAKDTLLLHQIMLYHDIGYAMDPVRGAMKTDGVRGQDAGHALLAAQFVREQMVDPASPWHKVFNTQDFETMHRAISFHDSPDTGVKQVDFSRPEGPNDLEGKRRIIESIVRTADNTHAFEDKLPALMNAVPESLKYMRLLKTAGETGDPATITAIKEKFKATLGASNDISSGDKEAFMGAIDSLVPQSYKYTVGRIAGRKPEYKLVDQVDGSGVQVQISVVESPSHRSVVEAFGMGSFGQMRKFVEDVLGEKFNEEDFLNGKVSSRDLEISFRKKDQAYRQSTQYEQNVMRGLKGKEFQAFLNADVQLIGRAQSLANDINKAATGELDDSALRARVRATLGPQVDQIPDRDGIIAALESTQNQIGQQRLENLQNYLALTT